MVILHMNNKGFLLVDALVNVIIVTSIAILCIAMFKQFDNYYDGYKNYIDESNEKYEYLFIRNSECETCQIRDLSNQDT